MSPSHDTWQMIAARLAQDQPVILVVVVSHQGSTPGKRGFKMVVDKDGPLCGTVGGGKMEFDLVALARDMIARREKMPVLLKRVHRTSGPESDRSGMICAGEQQLVLQPLNPENRGLITTIATANFGFLQLSPAGIGIDEAATAEIGFYENKEGWCYRERLGLPDTVYVIGSGHVGLALCRVMASLDFRIVAFDHRPDVPTVTGNHFADEVKIMDYQEIGDHIEEGDQAFAVIVTTAYPSDEMSLRQLVGKRLRYIGLMGSAAKLKKIFAAARAAGVSAEVLETIHAPIGLPINNRTPAEIAVSIAAQIIDIRNS